MASFNLGGGLVEIAALTALVGSSSAESLMLGSKGAAGLPWAAMSMFGVVFIIKACVSASTPGWLRDTIGVRNSRSDDAIGLSLNLVRNDKGKKIAVEAVGVSYATKLKGAKSDENDSILDTTIPGAQLQDVYALDTYTSVPLRSCAAAKKSKPLQIYVYSRDPHWRYRSLRRTKRDWFSLLLSMIKILESVALWKYGATQLYWITGFNWLFFFVSALILQVLGQSREYNDYMTFGQTDLLAGQLPTPQFEGEGCRILLGVPKNVRLGYAWRVVWVIGALLCCASLIATYVLLGNESTLIVYVWTGFQILWLVLRSVFFYLAEETDDVQPAVASVIPGKNSPPDFRSRLLGLASALSKYQMLVHPRGAHCYKEDLQLPTVIQHTLRAGSCMLQPKCPAMTGLADGGEIDISIHAVIGDTLLSSVARFHGCSLTGMDLYDSCLIVLYAAGQRYLIPSARVFSGPPLDSVPKDIESSGVTTFVPKGASSDGYNGRWWYWIPCTDGRWLQVLSDGMAIVGKRKATVLSGAMITRKLQVGDLFISLTDVAEIEDIVDKSNIVGRYLCEMAV